MNPEVKALTARWKLAMLQEKAVATEMSDLAQKMLALEKLQKTTRKAANSLGLQVQAAVLREAERGLIDEPA